MAKGVPLTPEQIAQAAEVYAQTGNYSAAGDAIGVAPQVARRALLRAGESKRVQLHARACARGIRRARHHLTALLERLALEAMAAEADGLVKLSGALAKCTETLLAVDARSERNKSSRLTRAKTRAEIESIRGNRNAGPIRVLLDWDDDPDPAAAEAAPASDLPGDE